MPLTINPLAIIDVNDVNNVNNNSKPNRIINLSLTLISTMFLVCRLADSLGLRRVLLV